MVGTRGLRRRGVTTGRDRRSGRWGRRPPHGGSKLTGSLSTSAAPGCAPRAPTFRAPAEVPADRARGGRGSRVRHDEPVTDALTRAVLETERHVAEGGWDQPPRLFALV